MSPLFPSVQTDLDLNGPKLSFTTQPQSTSTPSASAYSGQTVAIQETHNGLPVRGYLYYPTSLGSASNLDVVVLYHGTIEDETGSTTPFEAAQKFLQLALNKVNLKDKLIFSVAYPQDAIPGYTQTKASNQFPGINLSTLYFGDNIRYVEAALLWVENSLNSYLLTNNIPKTVNKVYTFGHSQGAYLAHRLNTLKSARYEVAFDMLSSSGGRQATAVRSFSLTISGNGISTETVNVTDTKGTVTTTSVGQNITVSVNRYITNSLSGISDHPIGSIKYIIDIGEVNNPSLQVSVTDTSTRGSGVADPNSSIAVSSGYPKLISANNVPPLETLDVTDTKGTITTSNLTNMSATVTRYIQEGLSGISGHPIGSIKYIVDVTGVNNPSLRVPALTDPSTRGSGVTDPNASIAVAPGYPKLITPNRFEVAFDMDSSAGGRQATAVRNFTIKITSDGGAPVGGVISNAPGPIDLLNRCSGVAQTSTNTCLKILNGFGSTITNPNAYLVRSLKSYMTGTLFPTLFTQAEDDTEYQVNLMKNTFQVGINACTNCATTDFNYYDTGGHDAFAVNPELQKDIRDFLGSVGAGIATFTGIATATFPVGQDERSTNTGILTQRWYMGEIPLTDGTNPIGNVIGSGTTTLTLTGLTNPLANNPGISLRADYIPSAYGSVGVAKSTPNASNEPLSSNVANVRVFPTISITTQPESTVIVENATTTFSIAASTSDNSSGLGYQWYLNGSKISGANSRTVQITRSSAALDKVYCEVTHPTAHPGIVTSTQAELDVVPSRTFLKWELIGGGTVQDSGERNLATSGLYSQRARSNVNARIVQMWSPEKDIDVKITLGAAAGAANGGYRGGNGGISVFKMTLKKNTEYTVKLGVNSYEGGGPRGGNNGGGGLAVIYEKARVIAVCGGGGGAGSGGRGGDGGGCNVAGERGQNGANGGDLIGVDQLPPLGMTQAGRTGFNDFDNDNSGSGRLSGCTIGADYWRQIGYAPCVDIPSTEPFKTVDGGVLSNTTGITRGYKTGQGHRNNGGAGSGNGGGGGAGARGGQGDGNNGGGGGASGYYASAGEGGEVKLLSSNTLPNGTQLGGNDDVAFICVEAYSASADQEPCIPPRSTSTAEKTIQWGVTRGSSETVIGILKKKEGSGPDQITFGPNTETKTSQISRGAVYELDSTLGVDRVAVFTDVTVSSIPMLSLHDDDSLPGFINITCSDGLFELFDQGGNTTFGPNGTSSTNALVRWTANW